MTLCIVYDQSLYLLERCNLYEVCVLAGSHLLHDYFKDKFFHSKPSNAAYRKRIDHVHYMLLAHHVALLMFKNQ